MPLISVVKLDHVTDTKDRKDGTRRRSIEMNLFLERKELYRITITIMSLAMLETLSLSGISLSRLSLTLDKSLLGEPSKYNGLDSVFLCVYE